MIKYNKKAQIKMDKKFLGAMIFFLIVLVLVLEFSAQLIPQAQSSGDSLTDAGRCTSVGCDYNATMNTTSPCRNNASQESIACETANPTIPFGDLYGGSSVLFLTVSGIILLVLVIGTLVFFKLKKK